MCGSLSPAQECALHTKRSMRLALCDAEQVALESGCRFGLDATTDLAAGNYLNKAVIVLRQGQDHLKRTIALD